MTVPATNYPQPVQVNGFTCRNCTDVDYAKQHIDPAHPKSGPFGVDAAIDPSRRTPSGAIPGRATQAGAPPQSAGSILDLAV